MNTWFLLLERQSREAPLNMAADQHILECLEDGLLDRPVLRIYGWARPTLSLGYHQTWERTVNAEALTRHGVDLVRRWTGGRAVLHDFDEITYSLVAPIAGVFGPRIRQNYDLIGGALARFTDLGVSRGRQVAEEPSPEAVKRMRHAPCFASLGMAEIEKGGRKLIGSAQKMGRRGFLQHGSIPMIHRAEILQDITGAKMDMGDLMTSLQQHYEEAGLKLPTRDALIDRLADSFREHFDIQFEDIAGAACFREDQVRNIAGRRYGLDAWTFRK